jgi:hypothetical protein
MTAEGTVGAPTCLLTRAKNADCGETKPSEGHIGDSQFHDRQNSGALQVSQTSQSHAGIHVFLFQRHTIKLFCVQHIIFL